MFTFIAHWFDTEPEEPSGTLVIDGNNGAADALVCVGDPLGGGGITWVEYGRVRRYDQFAGVPFSNTNDFIQLEAGCDYNIRFTKFQGMGMAVVPSDGGGTIRDCVFLLNVRGVDYQDCSNHKCHNCLFMGNTQGVRDYNGTGGEITNCTFDHNRHGVVIAGTTASLTVKNCLFHTTVAELGSGHGISIRNETVDLKETCNAFYKNDEDIYKTTGTPGPVDLNLTDYAYPANDDAATLSADPYDSAWTDFDDRFRLDPGGQCVDGGDD